MSGAARTLPQDYEDPFGATADPARYVPRDATERALAELEQAVLDRESSALLVGVPGIGKTLLLRLLRRRLEPRLQVIHLPYAALPPAALANWALDAMGVPSSWDPVGALATRAHHAYLEGRGGIALLIDDAEVVPEETARALAEMVRQARRGLRFVAAVDQEAADRLAGWLGEIVWVRLVTPMTSAEAFQYLHTRLHGAVLPARAIEAFDPDTVARLHERAGGIPGRLGAEASAVLLRALLPGADEAGSAAPPAENATDRLLEDLFRDAEEGAPATGDRAPAVAAPTVAREPTPTSQPVVEGPPAPPARTGPPPAPSRRTPAPGEEGETLASDSAAATSPERLVSAPGAAGATEPGVPDAGAATSPEPPAPVPEPPEAALERAAGRLALSRSGVETGEESAAFERAAGLLALAHEREAPAGEAATAPRRQAAAAPPGARAAPARPVRPRRRGLALGALFVVCFGIGAGVGLWLVREGRPGIVRWLDREERPGEAGGAEHAGGPQAEAPRVAVPAPAPPVRVQINASPWARIRVDGEEVGVTPLAGLPLAPGPHRFEARFPDGRTIERVEEVGPDHRWVVFP